MTRKWTLNTIVAALRRGETPETLNARYIGEGVERKAYRLGNWVIKSRASIFTAYERHVARQALRRAGLTPVPTRYVSGYMVQPYVRRFKGTRAAYAQLALAESRVGWNADVHQNNVGHLNGQLVAFDW